MRDEDKRVLLDPEVGLGSFTENLDFQGMLNKTRRNHLHLQLSTFFFVNPQYVMIKKANP